MNDQADELARLRAEIATLRSRAEAFESCPLGILVAAAPDARTVVANARFAAIMGGDAPADWALRHANGRLVRPEEQPLWRALQGEDRPMLDARHDRAGRPAHWVRIVAAPLRDPDGRITGAVASFADTDAEMRAGAMMRDSNARLRGEVADGMIELRDERAERAAAEEKVRQLQKMEAVGQLTGGIAHDFNNMLAVVLSGISLARRRLARGQDGVEAMLDAAADGAQRAGTLTQRLLAFSRQQALVPVQIEANRLVQDMSELLRRTLGSSVELETVLAGGLWPTRADASQLENAILNLAVNARDAMADGGKLTIETANCRLDEAYAREHADLAPGQYVMIAVTDAGTGISPEVIGRVFEPFFTTKPQGQGTGLGLSQIYGFVRQTGGHIKLYSEVGHGTTVKIYLPRQQMGRMAAEAAPPGPAALGGAAEELVLVVEDEERVRQVAVAALRELGYSVIHADGPAEALLLVDRHPSISLLFTDIVMPGMNGRRLADTVRKKRPALPVLFTTGYTRNAVVHQGVLDEGVHLLAKPYSIEQLAVKIREALRP